MNLKRDKQEEISPKRSEKQTILQLLASRNLNNPGLNHLSLWGNPGVARCQEMATLLLGHIGMDNLAQQVYYYAILECLIFKGAKDKFMFAFSGIG